MSDFGKIRYHGVIGLLRVENLQRSSTQPNHYTV